MTKYGMLFAALFFANALAAPVQPARGAEKVALDFSDVTSLEQAKALEAKGVLVKILLFPAEVGGEDVPANTVYVPKAAADAKDLITGTIVKFIDEGLIDKLIVEPEYKGNSFVPSRLVMKASHSTKDGKFEPTVEVW